MTLFSYVVDVDDGNAPHPFNGLCSLAVCKPAIRRTANVGDWIAGTNPIRHGFSGLVFAMQVSDAMTFEEYWSDHPERRPSTSNELGDNMYKPSKTGLVQIKNCCHGPEDQHHDNYVNRVLVGRRFFYFGGSAVELPQSLWGIIKKGQGHKSRYNDSYKDQFVSWLTENHREGIRGEPQGIDPTKVPTTKLHTHGRSAPVPRRTGHGHRR